MKKNYWHSVQDNYVRSVQLLTFLSLLFIAGLAQAQSISGTVFRDFNSDGVKTNTLSATSTVASYNEVGVPGVLVTAYNTSGAVAATAVTSSNTATLGNYTLTVSAGQYRIEFTNLQQGDFDGFKGSGTATSVQFVTAPSTTANFGINYPGNYCQSNPFLITSCYTNGDPKITTGSNLARNDNWVVGWKYNGTSNARNNYLAKGSVGPTWGLAYQRTTQSLFAAAMMKRHTGFGDGGPGQIYRIVVGSPTSSTITSTTITPFVNLTALGINVGADPRTTTPPSPTTAVPSANYLFGDKTKPNYDVDAFDLVGKRSLGDMDISDDDKTLWVINLFDRSLYELPIGNPATAPSASIQHTLTGPSCPSGVFRPWAVKYYRGKVYVGGVCTGENTTPSTSISPPENASTLSAYVYVHDPAGAQGNFTQVLTFPLNYPRGYASKSGTGARDLANAAWRPWIDSWSDISADFINVSYTQTTYPQPILSDIEFDVNGEMILGFIDRFGHQSGNANYGAVTGSTAVFEGVSAGDILRAGRNADGTYTIENNATVVHIAQTGANSVTMSSGGKNQSPGQGPGNGEYYWQDMFDKSTDINGSSTGHQEITIGGLGLWAGSGQVVSTAFDPSDAFRAAGARYFDNSQGDADQIYEILGQDAGDPANRAASFGKAAGLGDVELLCDEAPIMIGNRVWNDVDNDGVQDAGESALAGVVVKLKGPGLATGGVSVTTNSAGEYYFTNASGTTATGFSYGVNLTVGGSYSLCFPTSASALVISTKANSATGTNADGIDTDPDAAGIIPFTLGQAGQNNFTYDAGFTALPPCSLSLVVTAGTCQSATNTYSVTGTIAITNGVAQTLVLTDDSNSADPKSITLTATASTTALPFSLTGLESGSGFHTVTILSSATACGTASNSYVAPGGCLLACPGNLLANASFEQGLPSPPTATTSVTPPPSWTGGLAETNPTNSFNAPDGYAFAYTSGSSTSMCQSVTASVGSIYTLSFYAGVHQVNGQTVRLQFLNGSALVGSPKTYSITSLLSTGNLGGPFTLVSDAAPAGTTLVRVCAVGTGTGGNTDFNQWAKVDAMCLTEQKTCAMSLSVTPGACNVATNQYAVNGTVSLSNSPATSLTITDGTKSTVVSITAGQSTASFSFTGLSSGSGLHTISVISSGTTCGTVSRTYTAPASCSCASIGSLSPLTICQGQAIAPVCVTTNSTQTIELVLFPRAVTNPYSATGGIHIAEANVTSGTACITISSTAVPANTGSTSTTYVMYACLKPIPSDPNCQTITLSSTVFTVLPKPAVSLTVSPSLTVTQGNTITLTASGCTGGSLTWSSNVTGSSTIVTGIASQTSNTYSVTCTTGPGCTTTASVTVRAVSPASVQVNNTTVCAGSPASLTAIGCTGSLVWTGTGANNSISNVLTISTSSTLTSQTVLSYTATCTGQTSTTFAVGIITVVPQPSVTLTASSLTVVAGQSVTLTASGCAGTLSGAISGTATRATITPGLGSNVYSVTCAVQPGCSKTASVTVIGITPTTLTVMNTTVCAGATASLTAMGCTNTISWAGAGITSGGSTSIVSVSTSASIQTLQVLSYTATCSGVATVTAVGTVTIIPQPVLSLQASSTLVTVGTPVSLSAIGCTGTLTWSMGGSGNTVSVTPTNTTNVYSATCVTGPGCTTTALITVNTSPSANLVVTSATICNGTSATLAASGCTGSIAWSNGTTGNTLVTPALTANTNYTATCTTSTGSTTSAVGSVVVLSPVSLTLSRTSVASATAVTISVRGCTNGTLTWSTGAADNGKTSLVVPATTSGLYSVTCLSGPGCVATGRIRVGSADANEFTVNDAVICAGQSATLTTSGCLGTISWLGAGITGQTTESVLVTPSQTTVYTAICTNGASSLEVAAQVTVSSGPSISVTASSLTISAGQSATLTIAGCQNGTIDWSTGAADAGKTSIAVSPTSSTGYSVTCTTGPQCFAIANTFITVAQSLTPNLSLDKKVDKAKAQLGELVTYTLVLTNTGNGPATNVIVRDSISAGLVIIPGSVTTSVAGSYTLGTPISRWAITSMPANSTATFIFSASTTAEGVVYNKAMIPGDTASVCTSVPVKVCKGTNYAVELTAPAGYARYQWFHRAGTAQEVIVYDGALPSYTATAAGEYRVVVNDVQGKCPDLSCCPAIIEEDSIPVFSVMAKSPGCVANQPQANGSLTVMGLGTNPAQYSYAISEGTSFTLTNPTPVAVPANGVILSNANATKTYTVRIYNQLGCYRDVQTIITVNCACPPDVCVPVTIRKTKSRI